ncbi:hypothetical protein [Microbacterium sp. ABRD28]|uniref:hypothetical protein n=1 Tax=Microbacterium sp. ABRD28 TaxID=2268461 RepID=UPI000F54D89A|nr:hypothetical protein [Microbacterium sp. ABRD28]
MTLSLVSVFVLVTGCAPQPEPVESQGPFATEEEAFAAAEETYRNYVEALNAVDLSDPETFEPVYEWTTGAANATERESLTQLAAKGWRKTGDSLLVSFAPVSSSTDPPAAVAALACVDVSAVDVVDASGSTVVPETRPDRYAVELEFESSGTTDTGLTVSKSTAVESAECAG